MTDTGGVSPHDLDAERALLGAVLISPDRLADVREVVQPADMYRRAHNIAFGALLDLDAAGRPIDLLTLTATLRERGHLEDAGGAAYLAGLTDGVPRASNAQTYARIVAARARDRAAERAIASALTGLRTSDPDALARLREQLDTLDAPRDRRNLRLTAANTIAMRPVRWLWDERLPLGSLSLLAGREGIGKTILSATLAADVTRGRLRGAYTGIPQSVIIVATEDSWEHTIVPRLAAADADLTRVYRVAAADVAAGGVSLPEDLAELDGLIRETGTRALMIDPLLSRLDARLDTHKDADVRRALEPLAALADSCNVSILGLIHVSKSASTDPLTTMMASRAFAAVARSVLFVVRDPDDNGLRLLGTPKSNLGATDTLGTLAYRITPWKVADTPDGPVMTGKLVWQGDSPRSIVDALEAGAQSTVDRTATSEAADWLADYLTQEGGRADSADIKRAGAKAGHSIDALKRARRTLGIGTISAGFPRRTEWVRAPVGAESLRHPAAPTAPTTPTGPGGRPDHTTTTTDYNQSAQSAQSAQSVGARPPAPTEEAPDADVRL